MTDNQNTPSPDQLPQLLNTLLTNKELMEKISGIMGPPSENKTRNETDAPSDIGAVLSDPEIMSKLPEVISVLRPMLGDGTKQASPKSEHTHANDQRMALLCALKPYLSPKRCEAIDYFTRISKLGDMIKNLKF